MIGKRESKEISGEEEKFVFHNKRISERERKRFNKPSNISGANLFRFGKSKASLIVLTFVILGIVWYTGYLQKKMGYPSGSRVIKNGISYRLHIWQPVSSSKLMVSLFFKNKSESMKNIGIYRSLLTIRDKKRGVNIFEKVLFENVGFILDPRKTKSYELYAGGLKKGTNYEAVFTLTDNNFNKIKLKMEIRAK